VKRVDLGLPSVQIVVAPGSVRIVTGSLLGQFVFECDALIESMHYGRRNRPGGTGEGSIGDAWQH
jgi:hypothetical protein